MTQSPLLNELCTKGKSNVNSHGATGDRFELLKNYPPEGGTDHVPALKRALALHPEVIFFLTDADELTEKQVNEITWFNPQRSECRSHIYTIELNTRNRGRDFMPLQILARNNGGTYQAVSLGEENR